MSEINFNDVSGPDYRAVLLAELGFGTKFIGQMTHFSGGQVSYRTRQTGGNQRKGFRDGTSEMAQLLLAHLNRILPLKDQSVRAGTYETLRDRALQREAEKRQEASKDNRKKLAKALREQRKAGRKK